jgi:hypothetical protein
MSRRVTHAFSSAIGAPSAFLEGEDLGVQSLGRAGESHLDALGQLTRERHQRAAGIAVAQSVLLTVKHDAHQRLVIGLKAPRAQGALDQVVETLAEQPFEHRRVATRRHQHGTAQLAATQQFLELEEQRLGGVAGAARQHLDAGLFAVALAHVEAFAIDHQEVVDAELEHIVIIVVRQEAGDEVLLVAAEHRDGHRLGQLAQLAAGEQPKRFVLERFVELGMKHLDQLGLAPLARSGNAGVGRQLGETSYREVPENPVPIHRWLVPASDRRVVWCAARASGSAIMVEPAPP